MTLRFHRYPIWPEVRVRFLSLFVLLSGESLAATVPAGTMIDGAIQVDVTEHGLDALSGLASAFVPESIPVDPLGDEYPGLWDQCWLGGYAYEVSNLQISIEFNDIEITPNTGYLDVDLEIEVQINSISDPFFLYTELECIGSTCEGRVEPFIVDAFTTIALDVVEGPDGTPSLDATIGELSVDHGLTGDAVHLEDCPIGTILDILGFFGLDLIDILLPAVEGAIDDAVTDFGPEIETLLEDAFSQAVIDQEIDVQGSILHIAAQPGDVVIRPAGIRLIMDGMAEAGDAHPCVAQYDPGGSIATASSAPGIGEPPEGIGSTYALGALVSDDFGNQALYALWRSGLLCYTVDEDLGFPIDTSVLGLLAGDAFNQLFPDPSPMVIQTRPLNAPYLDFAGDNDVGILVDELGLDFVAELDHRKARVMGIGLDVDAGVNLGFDGNTGELGIEIVLDAGSFASTVTDNEFVPRATESIEASFASVFNGLIGGLLGDFLGDLSFAIPGFEGVGLTDLEITAAGENEDWLGAYTWIGVVPYESTSCGGCGGEGEGGGCAGDSEGAGCADTSGGCGGSSGGCAFSHGQRRWSLFLLPIFLVLLRRRD